MQSYTRLLIVLLLGLISPSALQAQETSPAAKPDKMAPAATAKRAEVYHVFFVKAALGKAAELAEFLKKPDPNAPHPDHGILLRHQEGEEWDYVMIEHIGPKATVENPPTPMPPAEQALMDSHNDTFVNGPSWAEFSKAMGIGADASKSAGSVYVVSTYRAAPGHREALEKMLSEPPNGASDTSVGNVLMQHLEGGAWNFLSVARYESWEKFAENEKNSVAQTNKNEGGWFELRSHVSSHNDTVTDRIAP
ncbi:MAG: hypothetical protein ABI787_10970 [Spartobacteria bacterium]